MRGETERFGRKFPHAFDPNKGNQETQLEQGTTPARGWSEKTTVRKEPPVRIRVLEKEKDFLTSGPIQAPDTVQDLSTHREQIKESILASQSNACMLYGHHVNGGAMFEENSKFGHHAHGGTILEETSEYGYHVNGGAMLEENSKYGNHAHGGTIVEENSEYGYHVNGGALLEKTSKGQNVLVSTISGSLNSTTTSSPKSQNKPPSSTWKRSAGREKSILYDVPVLHITGSKRNNEAILLGEDNGETGSKKAKGSVSDHLALVVSIVAGTSIRRIKKFVRRFEEKWATNPDCEKLIQESWRQPVSVGSPMFQLCQKISRCRMALIDWNREVFEVNSLQVNHTLEALEALHTDNHGGRHNHQIKILRDEVNMLLHQDEIHWRQRSREVWLAAGDKNTRYFHQKAKQRRGKNMVKGLLDSNGVWCEEETRVGAMAVQYFEDIFSASTVSEVENTVRCIPSVVTAAMNRQLLSQFTALEIQQATFQMHPSKAPDLIDAESGSWDVSILRKVFDEDSVQRVQQVVLTDCRRRDYPIWKHDSQGIFSVKSAYRVAVGANLHCEAVGSKKKKN
ncbi:hypothetical protein FCV25MIE_17699 [Fagus crenata]